MKYRCSAKQETIAHYALATNTAVNGMLFRRMPPIRNVDGVLMSNVSDDRVPVARPSQSLSFGSFIRRRGSHPSSFRIWL